MPTEACSGRKIRLGEGALGENADDGGGHQVSHCAGEHRTDSKPCKLAALFRSKRSDSANLDANRAEVREATERKGGDPRGTRVKKVVLDQLAELLEGHHLVDDHACAEQISHGHAVMPWDADEPCHRRKDPAENLLKTRGK